MFVYKLRPRGEKYWLISKSQQFILAVIGAHKLGTTFEFKQAQIPRGYYEKLSTFNLNRWKKSVSRRTK